MPTLPTRNTALDEAGNLLCNGLNPIPLAPRKKQPVWKRWQEIDVGNRAVYSERLRETLAPGMNLGVRCDNLVIVDEDTDAAGAYWAEKLGDLYECSTAWTSRKGKKTAYLLPEGAEVQMWPYKRDGVEFDVKSGSKHQVLIPPSVFRDADGEYAYEFVEGRGWDQLVQLSEDQVELFRKPEGASTETGSNRGSGTGVGETFEELLLTPGPERGNTWLTKLCGHLAKRQTDLHWDSFFAQIQAIDTYSATDPELARAQEKTARSIYKTETEKRKLAEVQATRAEAGVKEFAGAGTEEHPGNLILSRGRMWCYLESGALHCWLDAAIEPVLVIDAQERRFYRLRITGRASDAPKELTYEAWRLNHAGERSKILANLGYEVNYPTSKHEPVRLVTYLEAQDTPRGEAVPYLGWHPGSGFLGEKGMLLEDVLSGPAIAPLPQVVNHAAHTYGTQDTREEVVALLREIVTYQEPTVAAVGIAWWCMSVLKGRYTTSVFPILHLDAVSGSGKTNGFFAFLSALAGNTRGAGVMTVPQIRNQLAAVQNGVVWVDDVSEINSALGDILRQAATRGTVTKTGGDNTTGEEYTLVGSVLLSCEGVGSFDQDKAMRDRILTLKLPPVAGRKSVKPGRETKDQWFDIQETLAGYGGQYRRVAERAAGTAVKLVHEHAGLLARMSEMYPDGTGRHQDKAAILRMGAVIAESILGSEMGIRDRVERYLGGQIDQGQDNAFLLRILPRLIRYQQAEETGPREWHGIMEKNDTLYVHAEMCADAWVRLPEARDARDRQLGDPAAIRAELKAAGCTQKGERFPGTDVRARYWGLSASQSRSVRERAGQATRDSQPELGK